MQISLQTQLGVTVTPTPTFFFRLADAPDRQSGAVELCPVMKVDDDVTAVIANDMSVHTMSGLVVHDGGGFGVIVMHAGTSLVIAIVDIGDPEAKQWLNDASSSPGVAVVLCSPSQTRLVRVPVTDRVVEMRAHSILAAPSSDGARLNILHWLMSQLESDESLARMGLSGKAFSRVYLGFALRLSTDDDQLRAQSSRGTVH